MTFKKAAQQTLILFALILGTTLCVSAQRNVQRVQFPAGRTTVVLKGELRGEHDFTYVLRARRGQTLIAHLVENKCCASLMTKGPNNNSLKNADGTDAGNDFTIVLNRTGDYKLIVFPPDTADRKDIARYTLEVTIR